MTKLELINQLRAKVDPSVWILVQPWRWEESAIREAIRILK